MGYWGDFIIFEGFFADFKDAEDAYNVLMVLVCVACAGIAAGLTVGLLSLDETKLEIKVMIGTEEEKSAAESILPIIRQHHLLLVTLLLFNSVANETLPIFLGTLVPNYMAIILSVTLVLIFGEIIPTALFTGANQLLVAAKLSKLVYFLLILFYPISFPIAKILDYFIGEEDGDNSISREELEALVVLQGADYQYRRLSRENSIMTPQTPISDRTRLLPKYNSVEECVVRVSHMTTSVEDSKMDIELGVTTKSTSKSVNESSAKNEKISTLSRYEVNLMTGILKLAKFTVKDAMIPMRKVFMISSSTKLDEKSMYDILDSGFSRIPVFKRRDKQFILGYMLVKELIVLNPMDAVMIEDLSLREPICVNPSLGLMDMLRSFQEGQCHFALISQDPIRTLECIRNDDRPTGSAVPLGIVTMEDILEMIIQSEIIDETDSIHTNVYLGKTVSNNTSKNSASKPTIFYHSLRRNSHSNLSAASGSYSGHNKTSKSGIRIQQVSLRTKQHQAHQQQNAATKVAVSNVRRPSVTKMPSVVEADVPNQGRMVVEGIHMPSSRKRSMSGATHGGGLPSPSSTNNLTQVRSSSNFFSGFTSKLMGSFWQENNGPDVYARASVDRPNVIHVNKELQGLILKELPNHAQSGRRVNDGNAMEDDSDDYGEEEEEVVRLICRDGDSSIGSSNSYGFFDSEIGDLRCLSSKATLSYVSDSNDYQPLGDLELSYSSPSSSSSNRPLSSRKSPSPYRTNSLPTVEETPLSSSRVQILGLFPEVTVGTEEHFPGGKDNDHEYGSEEGKSYKRKKNLKDTLRFEVDESKHATPLEKTSSSSQHNSTANYFNNTAAVLTTSSISTQLLNNGSTKSISPSSSLSLSPSSAQKETRSTVQVASRRVVIPSLGQDSLSRLTSAREGPLSVRVSPRDAMSRTTANGIDGMTNNHSSSARSSPNQQQQSQQQTSKLLIRDWDAFTY